MFDWRTRIIVICSCMCLFTVGAPAWGGDFNGDGIVDGYDLRNFTRVLVGDILDPAFVAIADITGDGNANGLDIPGFIAMMSSSAPRSGDIGACCIPVPGTPGICLMLPEALCISNGGSFQGIGTTCHDPNIACTAPPPPVTACCLPNMTCVEITPTECHAQGGVPQGPFSSCAATTCHPNAPTGACCFNQPGLPRCVETRQARCEHFGGMYQGNGTSCFDPNIACPPPSSPPGACCLPNMTCVEISAERCLAMGGIPRMPGTTCASVSCTPTPRGACCVGHLGFVFCVEVTEARCMEIHGSYQGDQTRCSDPAISCTAPPPETVACCFPDGTCQDLRPINCVGHGGHPQGPMTTCNTTQCPPAPPHGACCLGLGGLLDCMELTENQCMIAGGTYQGNGTTCHDPNIACPIPPPTPVACCFADGTCHDLLPLECHGQGGRPQGPGSSCANTVCPVMGACCVPGLGPLGPICVETTGPDCLLQGGHFFGAGTSCSDPNIVCMQPAPVACCFPNGACHDLIPFDCHNQGGAPQAPGTSCSSFNCGLIGACCLSNAGLLICREVTEPECHSLGGAFQGAGTNCTATGCPMPVAACCFADGTCTEIDPFSCFHHGGHPQGPGSTCAAVQCPIFGACCIQSPMGIICRQITLGECNMANGQFQGPGSLCSDPGIACPPSPVACCFADGTCQDLDPLACMAMGGHHGPPGSSCNSVQCPVAGACCIVLPGTPLMCIEVVEPECNMLGGSFQGAGTSCSIVGCPSPIAACCLPDGSCQDLEPFVCFNQNGHPGPLGSSCAGFICPTFGACCIQSPIGIICREVRQQDCAALGGAFQGAGSRCSDPGIACPTSTVACCFPDGSCQDLDPVVCFNNNGHPGPLGSTCANFICPTPGACCIQSPMGLICRLLTQPECMAVGGMFQGPGTSCLDPGIACPAQPVACCLPGGACMDLTPTQCHNQGGQSQGPGTSCSSVTCAPIGACCIANAGFIECRMVTQQQCSALNGAYQGNGTMCSDPNIMCPGTSIRVACCFPNSQCMDLDPQVCQNQGGIPQGPSSTCSNTNCP